MEANVGVWNTAVFPNMDINFETRSDLGIPHRISQGNLNLSYRILSLH